MNEKPKTLGDVMGKDLPGWKMVQGYCLALSHGLMGFFPAVTNDESDDGRGEIVVCIEKIQLKRVWDKLRRRKAHVDSFQLLVNEEMRIGFDVKGGADMKSLRVFLERDLDEMCAMEDPFRWARGLLSFSECPEDFSPDFGD